MVLGEPVSILLDYHGLVESYKVHACPFAHRIFSQLSGMQYIPYPELIVNNLSGGATYIFLLVRAGPPERSKKLRSNCAKIGRK